MDGNFEEDGAEKPPPSDFGNEPRTKKAKLGSTEEATKIAHETGGGNALANHQGWLKDPPPTKNPGHHAPASETSDEVGGVKVSVSSSSASTATKPPPSGSEDEQKSFIRKRNALYARRKYARKKEEFEGLQHRCLLLEDQNHRLKVEQRKLEALMMEATRVVSVFEAVSTGGTLLRPPTMDSQSSLMPSASLSAPMLMALQSRLSSSAALPSPMNSVLGSQATLPGSLTRDLAWLDRLSYNSPFPLQDGILPLPVMQPQVPRPTSDDLLLLQLLQRAPSAPAQNQTVTHQVMASQPQHSLTTDSSASRLVQQALKLYQKQRDNEEQGTTSKK